LSAKSPNAWSGIRLFVVTARNGAKIALHEEWYHVHILHRKREMTWISDLQERIKQALISPVEIREQHRAKWLFVGPPLGGIGMLKDCCLHVAVQSTGKGTRGVVLTVMLV
jgi:hypothetical protein